MAVAVKSKVPAADSIMAPDKMKPLLAMSKQEPVQAAIALTADGDGLILLDKKAKPKKVLSMLRADAAKAKIQLNTSTLRFGRALVDTEYDSGMVRFYINKEAPGVMRVKLAELVKRVPYQKVELNVDPSLEAEPEEDGEVPSDPGMTATSEEPAPIPDAPPPPPEAPESPRIDAGALAGELGLLARRIAGVTDATVKARLLKLATDANVNIKTNNLTIASGFIAQLREGLDGAGAAPGSSAPTPPPQPTAPVQPAGPVAYAKSRLAWIAARQQVEAQIERLRAEVIATFEEDGTARENAEGFAGWISPVLSTLDLSLADTLDSAVNASDPAQRAELVNEAKTIIGKYQAFLSSPLLADLETNPFLPVTIRATLERTLGTLASSIH